MTYEGLRLKLRGYRRKIFANCRKKKITNTSFTIISNNCWGGMIYESYNLPKQSPTVGMFFYADDYIKFLKNLKKYTTEVELKFINPNDSKWKKYVENDKRFGTYPVGVLDDIEIFFLHYSSEAEAKEKWERRCKRINWDRMIVKFNDQNLCSENNLKEFLNLEFKNKLFFTCKDWKIKDEKAEIIKIKQHFKKEFILASHEPFGKNKYINLNKYINNLK